MGVSRSLLIVSLVLLLTGVGRALEESIDINTEAMDELNKLLVSLASEIHSAGTSLVDLKVQTSDLLKNIGTFKLGAAVEETGCRQLCECSKGLSSDFAELRNLVVNEMNSWTRFSKQALEKLVQGQKLSETGIMEGLEEFREVLKNVTRPVAPDTLHRPSALTSPRPVAPETLPQPSALTSPRPVAPETLPQPSARVAGLPHDCSEALARGARTGVTAIAPGRGDTKRVWCDQDTDGGGWTVLVRRQRQDPQLGFARSRQDYVMGFGDPAGEYWLGLEALVTMTANPPHELFVTMAKGAQKAVSRYGLFRVGSSPAYSLSVSQFDARRSTGGDSLTYHNGKAFTTNDRDMDGASGGNCAGWSGGGGWWYEHCFSANPTGRYGGGRDVTDILDDTFLEWRNWQGRNVYLTQFAMMIRPRQD